MNKIIYLLFYSVILAMIVSQFTIWERKQYFQKWQETLEERERKIDYKYNNFVLEICPIMLEKEGFKVVKIK